jgi:hypothetical protein
MASTSKEVVGKDGKSEWVNPLVKANGKLMYSKGRMGRAYGENEWVALKSTMDGDEV